MLLSGRPAWYDTAGKAKRPLIITICGPTCSGKSVLAHKIISRLNMPWIIVLRMEAFLSEEVIKKIKEAGSGPDRVDRIMQDVDFDLPENYDFNKAAESIEKISRGERVYVEEFRPETLDFAPESQRAVYGADVVILVGSLALEDQRICDMSDIKLFTFNDDDTRLSKRLKRDVNKRGRSVTSVLRQYEKFVKPGTENYVMPLRKRANMIVTETGGDVVVDLIVKNAQQILAERGISHFSVDFEETELPTNVHVLPETNVTKAMQTIIRDRNTSHDDFIFYSDQLCMLLVEQALSLLPHREVKVTTPVGSKFDGTAFNSHICGLSIMRSGSSMEAPLRRVCKNICVGKILITSSPKEGARLIYVNLPPVTGKKVLVLDPMITTGASATMALHVLVDHNVKPSDVYFITHIATVRGLHMLCKHFPEVTVITGIVDKTDLEDQDYLNAGLGYQPERYYV